MGLKKQQGRLVAFGAVGVVGAGGMRMAELATRSGVARETIHFYLREGLLPKPKKGGRTVAYYGEEHLERLRTIRRLREEKYLPLAVIRRLLESPVAAAPRDIDVLAEVLHLGSPAPVVEGGVDAPSAEALRAAAEMGFLCPARRDGEAGTAAATPARGAVRFDIDPSDRRVLAVVDEALALGDEARSLTLADLSVCAGDLTSLVTREAELFFDLVLTSGDVAGSIAALRDGRGTVARFIAAYRDRMLRRIVDDLLVAIARGPEVSARSVALPLSPAKELELGAFDLRSRLREAASRGDTAALNAWIWHLFACGAGSALASLSAAFPTGGAGDRAAVLLAWGRLGAAGEGGGGAGAGGAGIRGLEQAAEAAPAFAIGQILAGEAALARALRRRDAGVSLLDQAVPALKRVVNAEPSQDEEARARVLGLFHRGRIEIALPPVLGRTQRGVRALSEAAKLCEGGGVLDPAASARVMANTSLALGRCWSSLGDADRAAKHFREAEAIDPEGPIGEAARAGMSEGGAAGTF